MSDPTGAWQTPYGTSPGSSTPSPNVTREWGTFELKAFFWLALINTAIIGGAGVIAWLLVHHY